jgi:RNA polymerase sigma-70 factor (ECF subfamily)
MNSLTLRQAESTSWDWEEMRSFCFAHAMRVVGCPDTAEEAAQEAMVRAWRHRDSCRQPDRPLGWLRRIAQNEAVRVACRRRDELTLDEALAASDGPADDSDAVEDSLLFRGILGTLSEADQELARLRYYEDLTCAKLADHFGLSEATVKVRLHRLRKRLRQRLEAQT